MKHSPKVLMVLHQLPHNSTFLLNKFYKLSYEFPVEMLAWDTISNLRKMSPPKDSSLKIRLGLPSLKVSSILKHTLRALQTFMGSPIIFLRFYSFLAGRYGTRSAFGKLIRFYPFLQSRADLVH